MISTIRPFALCVPIAAAALACEFGGGPVRAGAPDAALFCSTYCAHLVTCDPLTESDACESFCRAKTNDGFAKLSAPVADAITRCFENASCPSALAEDALGRCIGSVVLAIAPNATAQSFCEDLGSAEAKCGGQFDATRCLDGAKLYSAGSISHARACIALPCNALAGCESANLDALTGLTALDDSRTGSALLVARCTGSYACTSETTSKTCAPDGAPNARAVLSKSTDNACALMGCAAPYTLDEDQMMSDGAGNEIGNWSGDASSFRVCTGGDCYRCVPAAR